MQAKTYTYFPSCDLFVISGRIMSTTKAETGSKLLIILI